MIPWEELGLSEAIDWRGKIDLNTVAKLVYAIAKDKGFHNPAFDGNPLKIPTMIANIHGECSELMESFRHGTLAQPSEHVPAISQAGEELADIIIRALDMAHCLKIDITEAIGRKLYFNSNRPSMHGGKIV